VLAKNRGGNAPWISAQCSTRSDFSRQTLDDDEGRVALDVARRAWDLAAERSGDDESADRKRMSRRASQTLFHRELSIGADVRSRAVRHRVACANERPFTATITDS
jgi:hypothetical protein